MAEVICAKIDEITQLSLLGIKHEGNKHSSKPPVAHTPVAFTDNVTQYLDAQLEVLSEKLEDKLFSATMKKIWEKLIAVFPSRYKHSVSDVYLELD